MRFIMILFLLMNTVYAQTKSIPVYTQDKLGIAVTEDQPQFIIKLKSNPSTGYSWFLREYDNAVLTPVKHSYQPSSDKKLMGAPGQEVWEFRVNKQAFKVPQQRVLRLTYSRPWELSSQNTQLSFYVYTLGSSSS